MEKANKALLLKRGIGLRPSAYACRLFEIIAGQLYISENRGVGSNFLLFFFSVSFPRHVKERTTSRRMSFLWVKIRLFFLEARS